MRSTVLFEEVCGVTLGLQDDNYPGYSRAFMCRVISCILRFCNLSDISLGFPSDEPDDSGSSDDGVINSFEWLREGLDILPVLWNDMSLVTWGPVLSFLRQVRNVWPL